MRAAGFEGARSVSVDGISVAYVEQGQGEPVVLLHGNASDLRTWKDQLPVLGSSFRTIAYSRRYARPNADIEPGADDPVREHVRDLVELMDALGIDAAHLVGHSWGGLVALLAAMHHPKRVRSLVVMEPPAYSLFVSTPPRPGELLRLFAAHPRMGKAVMGFVVRGVAPARRAFRRGEDEKAMRIFGNAVLGEGTFARLAPERLQQVRDNVGVDRAQLLGEGPPRLWEAEVRRIITPTLFLHGDRSPKVFRYLTRHLQKVLPRAEVVEVPGASHILHEDNPRVVNEAIMRHLTRLASPSSH